MAVSLKNNTGTNIANVDSLGNLYVLSTPAALVNTTTAWSSATTINAVFALLTTGGFPAIVVQLNQTSTISGGAATFEGTYDGIDWVSIPVAQLLDPNSFAQLTNPYTLTAATNKAYLILTQGYQQVRLRLSTTITGTGTVTPYWNLLSNNPFAGTVSIAGTIAVSQSGSWTNTVVQPTAANLNATIVGTGTFAVQASQSGTWTVRNQDGTGNALTSTTGALDVNIKSTGITQPISGTVTANQGTSPWVVSLTSTTITGSVAVTGTVGVSNFPASQPVTNAGTFAVQATQSGTWTVGISA